jgi:hypothetical protein
MTTDLAWTCDACHLPIVGRPGFLHVQPWRVHEDAENPDTWHIHHAACLPAGTVDEEGYVHGYCITTDQVSTREALAYWTRHLAGKTWYDLGQWREMVQRSAGVDVGSDAARERLWSVDGGRHDEATDDEATGLSAG